MTSRKPWSALTSAQPGRWRRLLGALVVKAAAYSVPLDTGKQRHLTDFAILTTLISRSDQLAKRMNERDRRRLGNAIAALRANSTIIPAIDGAAAGIDRLMVVYNASAKAWLRRVSSERDERELAPGS